MSRRDTTQRTAAVYPAADQRPPAAQAETKPGWQRLEHVTVPRPTYWPAVLALGVTFLAWGLISSMLISAAGLLLLVVALGGWIGELLHGH